MTDREQLDACRANLQRTSEVMSAEINKAKKALESVRELAVEKGYDEEFDHAVKFSDEWEATK